VPGGHFVFADVCTYQQWAALDEVCDDPPGVDRAAVQRQIEALLGQFLADRL
jgi:hypothetical protein